MALDLGTLRGFLELDTTKWSGPLDEAEGKARDMSMKVPGWMGAAAAGIVAGGIAAGVGLVALGGSFDDLADGIAVATGASGDELQGFVDVAKQAAVDASVPFEKMGPIVSGLVQRLGLSGEQLQSVATQIATAGRILGEDINMDAATGALAAFKVEGDAVEGSLDFMFQTSQRTGIGMNDLMSRVQSAAPITQQLGFSLEETAGMIGTMNKAGLDSQSMIGAMQKGLAKMTEPGESARDTFTRVTDEIQGFIDKGDTASARAAASEMFGTKGAAQFVGALQSGVINMEDLAGMSELTGGTIMETGAQTADFAETWQSLVNETMLMLEPIAAQVFGALSVWLSQVREWAQGAFAWVAENKDMLAQIGIVIGAIAATYVILTGAVMAYNAVMTVYRAIVAAGTVAQWLMNAAMAANPVGLVVIAISLLIGALVLLIMNWDSVVAFLGDVWGGFVGWLTDGLNALASWWNDVWGGISDFVTSVWEGIVAWIEGVWTGFQSWIFSMLLAYVTFWMGVWNNVRNFFTGLWNGIVSFFTGIWNGIVSFITAVVAGIVSYFATRFGEARRTIETIFSAVSSFISSIWNGVRSFLSGVIGGIVGFFTSSFNNVSSFLKGIWEGIGSTIRSTWNGVTSFLSGIPDKIMGFFSGIGDWLWNAGRDLINGLLDGISSLAGTIGSFFLNLLPGWIVGPFKAALGIASPSRLFARYGRDTIAGYIGGIEDMQPDLEAAMNGIAPTAEMSVIASGSSAAPLQPVAQTTKTVNYYAAEHQSLSGEEALLAALSSPRVED